MAETSGSRNPVTDAVVRPLSRVAGRPCSRPGCPSPSDATLVFRYGSREAWLGPLSPERSPETYDLCINHAGRTRPPHGWRLVDERPDVSSGGPGDADFGGERTVAVLAAALRGDDGEPEDASPALDGDPLREALEELQAVALRIAENEEHEQALRFVDRSGSGEHGSGDAGPEAQSDTGPSVGEPAGDAAGHPPGRRVPAARQRETAAEAATLW